MRQICILLVVLLSFLTICNAEETYVFEDTSAPLTESQLQAATQARIAIIGAGMSGINVGRNLIEYGIEDFVVFEAQNRIGGRMYSKPLGSDGINVDGGAMWIQGLGTQNGPINPIWDFVRKSDIECHLVNWNKEAIYDVDGTPASLDYNKLDSMDACVVNEIQSAIQRGELRDISSLEAMRLCGFEPETALERAGRMYYHDFEWSETPAVTSTNYTANFPTYDYYGDTDCLLTDNRGYGEVVLQLMDQYYQGGRTDERVILNAPVFNINTADRVIELKTGEKLQFDYIINSMPIGVVQYEMRGTGRKNNDPPLYTPEWSLQRRSALEAYHMVTYHKTFLRFEEVFWDAKEIIIKAPLFPEMSMVITPMDIGSKTKLRPGTGIICVQHFSDVAIWMDEMSDADILELIMTELRLMYGKNIPDPTYVSTSLENDNPYQRYSYSNVPVGFSEDEFALLFEPENNHYFTGEARCRNLNGYVHGAYLAGQTTALEVLRDMQANGISELQNLTLPDPYNNACWRDPRTIVPDVEKRALYGRKQRKEAARQEFLQYNSDPTY